MVCQGTTAIYEWSLMIEYFDDWAKVTGIFQENTVTTNSAGQVVESWADKGSSLTVQFWTDSSNETNVNDRFVDQKTGRFLVTYSDIDFTPTTQMRFKVSTTYYYITGVDNVANMDEFYVINWRLQNVS